MENKIYHDNDEVYYCLTHMMQNETIIYKNSSNFVIPKILNGLYTLESYFTIFEIDVDLCINSTLNNNSCADSSKILETVFPMHFQFFL